MAPILLIFLRITVTRASCLVRRQKTPDRRHNLSRPYIKLEVYGQTVLLDGGHGRIGPLGSATVARKCPSHVSHSHVSRATETRNTYKQTHHPISFSFCPTSTLWMHAASAGIAIGPLAVTGCVAQWRRLQHLVRGGRN